MRSEISVELWQITHCSTRNLILARSLLLGTPYHLSLCDHMFQTMRHVTAKSLGTSMNRGYAEMTL